MKPHFGETGWVGYGSQEPRCEEGVAREPGAPGRSWWGRRGLEGAGLASLALSEAEGHPCFSQSQALGGLGAAQALSRCLAGLSQSSAAQGLELSQDPWGR